MHATIVDVSPNLITTPNRAHLIARGCLTSATGARDIFSGTLGSLEGGESLRDSRMDADGVIEVSLRCSELQGNSIALGDLTSIGR